jgi:hypothetical protein
MLRLSMFSASEFAVLIGIFLTAICLITWAMCGLADHLGPEDWGVSDEEESDYQNFRS